MADNSLDVRCPGAFDTKQVMLYMVFRHHVYEQFAGICQVKHVAHVTRVAVFHWQRHAFNKAVHAGLVCSFEIRECYELGAGEEFPCRYVCVCTGNTAVAYPHPAHKAVLVVA